MNRRGFTFVEMTVVILVIGITAAIAVPSYVTSIHEFRAQQSAERIIATAKAAKSRAMLQSRPIRVRFTVATHTVSVVDAANVACELPFCLLNDPYRSQIAVVALGADPEVSFDAYGLASKSGDVTLSSGSVTRVVRFTPNDVTLVP